MVEKDKIPYFRLLLLFIISVYLTLTLITYKQITYNLANTKSSIANLSQQNTL